MSLNPSKALVGLLAILIITGCNDRTRDNCQTRPTAHRCATGATTP